LKENRREETCAALERSIGLILPTQNEFRKYFKLSYFKKCQRVGSNGESLRIDREPEDMEPGQNGICWTPSWVFCVTVCILSFGDQS